MSEREFLDNLADALAKTNPKLVTKCENMVMSRSTSAPDVEPIVSLMNGRYPQARIINWWRVADDLYGVEKDWEIFTWSIEAGTADRRVKVPLAFIV